VTVLLDHVLFVLLAAFFPVWAATFGFRRLLRAAPADRARARVSLYRRAIAIQWALVAVVAAMWLALGRGWLALGLVPRITGGLVGVLVGLVFAVLFILRQRAAAIRDESSHADIRRRLGKIELMMPRSRGELAWFFRLSFTAGVCEEILYRGYLLWYLGHWLAPVPSLLVAAALFGIGHSYQGWRGMLLTAVLGAFFGEIYGITGSLFAPMLIHALMDAHSGHLGYVVMKRASEREEEERAAAAREAGIARAAAAGAGAATDGDAGPGAAEADARETADAERRLANEGGRGDDSAV
jgi:CAAX protease family protein